jgi:hypothetical protein
VDLAGFKIVGSIPTPPRHPSFWTEETRRHKSRVGALILTKSEDKGYLTYERDDEVSVVDLRAQKLLSSFRLQSGAAKFGWLMLEAAIAGAVAGAVQGFGNVLGGPGLYYVPAFIALPESEQPRSAALDRAERTLYLLGTDGVSVVDTEQLKRIRVLNFPSPSAFYLNEESANRIMVVGTLGWPFFRPGLGMATFDLVSGKRLTGGEDFAYVSQGNYAVDHDDKVLRLRNPKSLEVIKSVDAARSIQQVVWIEN